MSNQTIGHNIERRQSALPRIGKIRLAEVTDVPFVFKLVNEQMAKTFRIHDPEDIAYLM